MGKPTLLLIIILFLIALGLLIVALNKSFYNINEESKLPVSSAPITDPFAPDTSLLFGNLEVASSSSYPISYSVPILIITGANKVTAVQLELSFDPNVLTNVNITPSTFFQNPSIIFNKINSVTGRISYALSKTATESAKYGKGTLATLTFNSLFSSVSSAINFLPRTFVTAEGLENSALKSTNSALLQL